MSRGLIAEKKDGAWEMSTGRVAFWLVLSHCFWVWHKMDPAAPGNHMDVSEGELNTLWLLLSYSGLKVVTDTVASFKKKQEPVQPESNG